ncbi:glycosyltransferase family 39 protein [Sphingomonas sp. GlSt437]|uniref:glycosyltransferase family 39 protein n=1 Tax=Sphingomonas sp. GlSt437 TaxID=3389970 RepID=UPI003A85AFFE
MADPARFPWRPMIGLGAAAEVLFLNGLARDPRPYFDETHYVPAARTLLALTGPVNIEHPLFAKELIAAGILLFGDNAWGWRVPMTLCGAATVIAIFAIGWQLWREVRPAIVGALIALTGFTLFVEARLAMLDGPMAALALAAIAVLLAAVHARNAGRYVALAGALFGLGVAAKWAALPWFGLAGLALGAATLRPRGLFGGLGPITAGALFAAPAVLAYFITFAPAFFYADQPLTLATLIPFQADIYAEQTLPMPSHPYQSNWWSWPLDLRPIWYLYEPVDGVERGVLMLGNPAVMWGGLIGLGYGLIEGARRRAWPLLAPVALWAGAYLPWIIIPKKIGFFYYYYGASLCLPLAIAGMAHALDPDGRRRLGWIAVAVSTALFLWFYPILSAAALEGPDAFLRWMWLASWP